MYQHREEIEKLLAGAVEVELSYVAHGVHFGIMGHLIPVGHGYKLETIMSDAKVEFTWENVECVLPNGYMGSYVAVKLKPFTE